MSELRFHAVLSTANFEQNATLLPPVSRRDKIETRANKRNANKPKYTGGRERGDEKRKFVQFFTREIERMVLERYPASLLLPSPNGPSIRFNNRARSFRCSKVNKRATKRARVSQPNNVIGDRAAFERVRCRLIGKLPV